MLIKKILLTYLFLNTIEILAPPQNQGETAALNPVVLNPVELELLNQEQQIVRTYDRRTKQPPYEIEVVGTKNPTLNQNIKPQQTSITKRDTKNTG